MNKKMIISLVIVAAVLLVSTVVLLLLAQRSTPTEPAVTNTTSDTSSNTAIPANTNESVPTNTTNSASSTNITVTVDSKTSLYQTARFFTERYGSYSTDNEHENIDSLRPFMTDAMQATADDLISTQTNSTTYYGVTTQTAHVDIIDYVPSATGATVEVVTRRVETTNGDTKEYTQTARLQLKKINDAWKVDTFKWQNI